MFKHYKDLRDVVSLLVFCPSDRTFLLAKESSGEYWMPSNRSEKHCWKTSAGRLYFDLFGVDYTSSFVPLRIYKIWLPYHSLTSIYHVVYKVNVKSDIKKKTKIKGAHVRLSWLGSVELERNRAHTNLKSPEIAVFTSMILGDHNKDDPLWQEIDTNLLVEVCEENVILTADVAAGAFSTPNAQLLQAANYHTDDQIRLYSEFILLSYPAVYMSLQIFTNFMTDIGWQRIQCPNLFRAADITGRGGLSFLEMLMWCAAIEPNTQHGGLPAEIRTRYIFRYYDSNRDMKLEYLEFKELVAAARQSRQLPIDALSVARDADVCLRQLGMQPNSQLPLTEFLRCVGDLRLRGTSTMLRSPRSISGYLADLQLTDHGATSGMATGKTQTSKLFEVEEALIRTLHSASLPNTQGETSPISSVGVVCDRRPVPRSDYNHATFTVRVRKEAQNEMVELMHFDEDAVSPSTSKFVSVQLGTVNSMEVLGPTTYPTEAIAAVHYFATPVEKLPLRRISVATSSSLVATKAAYTWVAPAEEHALGELLLKLAEAVCPICQAEPRLLRLTSPAYVVGDLHGNLSALLSMETALWPSGASICPAKLVFLGDFVDRGPHGSELMAYLLAAKLQRPNGIFLIRGNHETRDIQRMFTFHTECVQKYGDATGSRIWNSINCVFDVLPLAAVIDDKVFCCHGGIPPPWVCPLITAIDKVPVPLTSPAEQSTIAWELLWNDPVKPNKLTATLALELTANEGFAANVKRGTGHVFDQSAVDRFLLANQLSHVLRAHELHQSGFMCQMRGRLISVFSSSHYCGGTNDCGVALLEGKKLRLIRVGSDF